MQIYIPYVIFYVSTVSIVSRDFSSKLFPPIFLRWENWLLFTKCFFEIRGLISFIKKLFQNKSQMKIRFSYFLLHMYSVYINIIVDMHYHFKFCLIFRRFTFSFLLIENQYPPRRISIFITTSNTLRNASV